MRDDKKYRYFYFFIMWMIACNLKIVIWKWKQQKKLWANGKIKNNPDEIHTLHSTNEMFVDVYLNP